MQETGAGASTATLTRGARWKSRRAIADAARDRRDWAAAAQHYRAHLKDHPGDFPIWVQLGHVLKEDGRRADALVAYSRALGLRRDDPDLLLHLGHLHKLMGHTEAAIDCYERSMRIDGNPAAREELRALGQAPAAEGVRAAPPAPSGPVRGVGRRPLGGVALILARLLHRPALLRAHEARDGRDWAAAAAGYGAYLKRQPRDFGVWVQYGHALKEAGRASEALSAYERAMALDPRDSDLLLNLGHLFKVMGRRQEALDYYRRSAAIDGNPHALAELGRAGGSAEPGVARPLAPDPTARRGGRTLARWLRRLVRLIHRRAIRAADAARRGRDWTRAASLYGAYLAERPGDFEIWVQYGHALKESGRLEEALRAYDAARALEPDDADLLLNLGHLNKVMGRPAQAVAFYRTSYAIDGNQPAAKELAALNVSVGVAPDLAATQRKAALDAFSPGEARRGLAASLGLSPPVATPWFYFDPAYYLRQCESLGAPIEDRSPEAVLRHYLECAGRLKLDPNPLFSETYYQSRTCAPTAPTAPTSWSNGFEHYANVGVFAGRSPNWFFDPEFYAAACAAAGLDVARTEAASDLFSHYLSIGLTRGVGGMFLTAAAVKLSLRPLPTTIPDLIAWLNDPNAISGSLGGLFDPEWYGAKYGVAGSIADRLSHYLSHSGAQGLSPSATFAEDRYQSLYPDVREAVSAGQFANGYNHFLVHGMYETRRPFEAFDPDFYLSANAGAYDECVRYRLTPYLHFLKFRTTRELAFQPSFAARPVPEEAGKGLYERRAQIVVATAKIRIPTFETIEASIIIVAKNKFAETFSCIESVVSSTRCAYEVIVYDNGSIDDVARIEHIVEGVRVLRSAVNKGFTIPVNEAGRIARGAYIILINNDAEICPGAIDRSLEVLKSDPTIGVVGGRIIRTHGQLQEAGSIVWRDGSCLGYGRDLSPFHGSVDFQRDVDYCSGCYLALSAALWNRLGGFDEIFAPAYYEETDLCLRVWELGFRVVYDPSITLWHFEFGTSTLPDQAIALMRRNQSRFVDKHQAYLSECLDPAPAHIERARLRHVRGKRVLFIEDQIPEPGTGMGFVRSARVARALEATAGHLSLVGLHPGTIERRPWDRAGWGARTEVLREVDHRNLGEFLAARRGVYGVVWLSRTHNLAHLQALRQSAPEVLKGLSIIVDTEAVASVRAALKAELEGRREDLAALVAAELAGLELADEICVVSAIDKALVEDYLEARGVRRPVSTLGHAMTPVQTPAAYEDTRGLLLTGSFANPSGPNIDAVRWFDEAVRPRLAPPLRDEPIVIAGSKAGLFVETAGLQGRYEVMTDLADMGEAYRGARLVVAPTRYAAGIPYKVHEAAQYGVPVVMSALLGRQLGWNDDAALGVVADSTAEAFARRIGELYLDRAAWTACRSEQTRRIERECAPDAFDETVRRILARV